MCFVPYERAMLSLVFHLLLALALVVAVRTQELVQDSGRHEPPIDSIVVDRDQEQILDGEVATAALSSTSVVHPHHDSSTEDQRTSDSSCIDGNCNPHRNREVNTNRHLRVEDTTSIGSDTHHHHHRRDLASSCPCVMLHRPDTWDKALVARWMVHTLDWGVLTTISSRNITDSITPFGNVYSFVDGSCTNSTGIPYFYGTYMDQSFQDMKSNPIASFTLSEASLSSVCGQGSINNNKNGWPACSVSMSGETHHQRYGDPESPICARLTLTGTLVEVDKDSKEYAMMLQALYHRHPQMQYWPTDHNWLIVKLQLQDVWFIDYFGGATGLKVQDYLDAPLLPSQPQGEEVEGWN